MENIAIIGMGTSGMAVAAAYAKEVDPNKVSIDCYDSAKSFGRGYPYREESEEIILNLKTRKISYDYQNNDDLADWIKEKNLPLKDYTSRDLFGMYTSERLDDTLKKLGAEKITKKVKTLFYLEKENKWQLETEDGNKKVYDRVHLCAGELPQKDCYNLKGAQNYINSVYPCEENLNPIQKNDSVCVVGMGLTGADVASYLLTERKVEKLYMFSRSNVIPTVRVEPVELNINHLTLEEITELIKKGNGFISFEEFEDLFNKELESHGLNYEDFLNKHMAGGIEGLKTNINDPEDLAKVQALLPPLNLAFNKIWSSLNVTDRKLFRDKYHPFMCLNRSPLPLPTAEILIEAYDGGRLTVLENVNDIKATNNGKSFNILSYLNNKEEILASCDYVCNATGLDTSMKSLDRKNTLVGSLINKRYLQVDDYGGVSVVPETMSAISPRFGILSTLHAYGVLSSGVQYRNNSTLIIQKTAHDLIKKLY